MKIEVHPLQEKDGKINLEIRLDKEGAKRWKEMRMSTMIYDVFMDEDRFLGEEVEIEGVVCKD